MKQMNSMLGQLTPQTNSITVLRNTYMLLAMTLIFSACSSWLTIGMVMTTTKLLIGVIAIFSSLFALSYFRNSIAAIPLIFVFTGIMGMFVGPAVGQYLLIDGGTQIVTFSLLGTAATTILLSIYAFVSKKDFSSWGGFLFIGLCVILAAMIINIFLQIPMMSLVISSVSILVFSGLILYDTSRIIHGGEQNYVMATVSLYLDMLNMFLHMLNIFNFSR